MLEALVVLLYISGMATAAGAIYGTMDNAHPAKAALAIVLWPVIPPMVCAVMVWEYVRETFR